jgi:hypothetical protein
MKKLALRLSATDLPGIYAVCDTSRIESRTFDTFTDNAFVIIFESQFDRVIGRQF